MSADAYSAQLNVRKIEGGPNSRNIQRISPFLLYQYCEVHAPTEALYTGLLLGVHQTFTLCKSS